MNINKSVSFPTEAQEKELERKFPSRAIGFVCKSCKKGTIHFSFQKNAHECTKCKAKHEFNVATKQFDLV